MSSHIPTYAEASLLLHEYNRNPRLLEHAYAVSATMQYYARKLCVDEEKWRIIGLVHDIDSELFPPEHCRKSAEILREAGWPEDYIHAVQSHGWGTWCDVKPESELEKIIYTIDKATWFVSYVTVKGPTGKLAEIDVETVMARWHDPTFAPGRNRTVIDKGAVMLGKEVTEIFADVINALRPVAAAVGL